MTFFDAQDPRPVHFVGIAGAGMSALAELLARRGIGVTGCDANPGENTALEQLGIIVQPRHDPAHVAGVQSVVATSAMPRDHPELARARELGIPVIRRAEALAGAVALGKTICIAGTHGKTTTTVMTTEALAAAERNPTGIVGGRVATWGGNLSAGGDELFVVEADEYDRSFLALTPTVATITNVEADHLDIYADLDDIRGAFAQFASRARAIVLCADDAGAASIDVPPTAVIVRYGISSPDARLVAIDLRSEGGGTAFTAVLDGSESAEIRLRVPGRHNVLNALAALGSGNALGVPLADMAPGLAAFGGVERRFQRLGEVRGVSVIDDYAHHPTEIRATLAAARAAYPGRRIVAAFQPHLYSRTRDFASDFGGALAGADNIYLTEIYGARERPIAGVSAALIERAASDAGQPLTWRGERAALAAALAAGTEPGDVVITLGAGDITRTGPELLALLSASR
ncbi:MAG: UDP-N-acetylmuramate--L-alanine ligase [Gemmatimonadaceae bacterium]|nr:UDP-N-acetylmuramate--L-alanine ligase [Gemmatimonadaceae bacterium]